MGIAKSGFRIVSGIKKKSTEKINFQDEGGNNLMFGNAYFGSAPVHHLTAGDMTPGENLEPFKDSHMDFDRVL